MLFKKPIFLILYSVVLCTCHLYAQEVQFISNRSNPNFGALKIFKLSKTELGEINRSELIKIFPEELFKNKEGNLPPMMGEIILEDNAIYFKPRFSFRPNKKYVVEINFENKLIKPILIPEIEKIEPTYLVGIFPTTDTWPANQLKIYLHFSAPMGLGNIYEHIKLLDENGEEVEKPFLEINPPLWDKTQQRLTLWFDPGRIKRHLLPNENMGPPLEENRNYTLVVSKKAKDAFGNNLSLDYKKRFVTTLNDRDKPDVLDWEINFPTTENNDPMMVEFSAPMDRGTLESAIGIIDENGKLINGHVEISDYEKRWLFIPKNNWQAGKYKLMFSEKIEDLAGNNLKRLFDQDISDGNKRKQKPLYWNFLF